MAVYMHCPLRQYCQRYKSNLSGAFTTLCNLLSGTAISGSTRDCDRSTVGLEITSPAVVRVVSSDLPNGGGGGVRTKLGSTPRSVMILVTFPHFVVLQT